MLIQDNPGLAKTLMARSFASVTGLRFARVQFTPDLMPSDVTGSAIYDQRSWRAALPARADLHEHPARRRDQPRAPEDPGGAAGGDARTPGDQRGRHQGARAPVPRPGHPEPDRVRGDLSAARGAARPLPAADQCGLPGPRSRARVARAPTRARPGRRRAPNDHRPRAAAGDAASSRAGARGRRDPRVRRRPGHFHAREPPGASGVESSRHARAAQARARKGGAGGPRLRDPR